MEPGEPRLDDFGPFQEIESFAYQHLRGRRMRLDVSYDDEP